MPARSAFALTFPQHGYAGVSCTLVYERATEVHSFRWILASQGSGYSSCRRLQGRRSCAKRVCAHQLWYYHLAGVEH